MGRGGGDTTSFCLHALHVPVCFAAFCGTPCTSFVETHFSCSIGSYVGYRTLHLTNITRS